MSSIIPGFEYDIFISYRHNDNRSGWVTEFAKELQEELAATIKSPLSVYFDVNPHDGLLETHDVDDSLKEKLKCLIFLPIISQTYCDPKSFAWSHEFIVFLKMAGDDSVGLKIRLPNGNVASRMLPVRIHELDVHDKKVIESELGPLRAIDFTYQSAGVNRPLRPKDDETGKSVSQNVYRDQINKTANAIKEIIAGLQDNKETTSLPEADSIKKAPPSSDVNPRIRNKKPYKFPELKTLFAFAIVLIAALSAALIYIATTKPAGPKDTQGVIRTSINLPDTTQVSFMAGPLRTGRRAVDISPDGKAIVFVDLDHSGTSHLYLRTLGAESISLLPGTADGYAPFFSPDSKSIAFFSNGKLMKISVAQGVIESLAQTPNPVDGIWGEDDRITWIGNEGASLNSIDSHGNDRKVHSSFRMIARPVRLSSNEFIVTTSYNEMRVISFATGLDKLLLTGCSGQAIHNNDLFFVRGTDLFSIGFDRDKLLTVGNPRLVEKGIGVDAYSTGQFSISKDGTIIFANGFHALMGHLCWRTKHGAVSLLPFDAQLFGTFSLSPDNRHVAIVTRGEQSEVWNYDLEDPAKKIQLSSQGFNTAVVWSPTSDWVYFQSYQDGKPAILKRYADGRGDAELVLSNDSLRSLSDIATTGTILYAKSESEGGGFTDIKLFRSEGTSADGYSFLPRKRVSEALAKFIGEGWITFTADQTGRSEVFLSDLLNPSVRIQVSFEGGEEPCYDSASSTLYYRNGNKLMAVSLVFGEKRSSTIGASTIIFTDDNWVNVPGYSYALSADGKRFLLVRSERKGGTSEIRVLQNF